MSDNPAQLVDLLHPPLPSSIFNVISPQLMGIDANERSKSLSSPSPPNTNPTCRYPIPNSKPATHAKRSQNPLYEAILRSKIAVHNSTRSSSSDRHAGE
ncbi:hypothetical protein LshimejAT787_0113050 [Lyophyllum shimeji]|uniref:Uncharacterized protein n=1 Tax=Lyophyllum shimeji TaxID=47721 RepID=A0A9P3UKI7_LYOSH|nr:hypothetical protein LshimejAT787_0113050 [Lyophyllum shimeji]